MGLEWELQVRLQSDTPVVGVELNPWFRVNYNDSYVAPPNYTVHFTWHKELSSFSENVEGYETLKYDAARALIMGSSGDGPKRDELGFLNAEDFMKINGEGKAWVKVGSSRTYIPSQDDIGSNLRLVSVAVNDMGIKMSPINICVTTPVIRSPRPDPRQMILFCSLRRLRNPEFTAKPFKDGSFRVLSYNILADLYTIRYTYSHCPKWALTWEYRRQNLLNEILSYGADIFCLQEVQSDHFKNFFEPEFAKLGYSAIYKKKTKEVYSANQYVIDGCATFFRHDRFNIVVNYEVEYDKMALPVIEMLEPGRRNDGIFRLMKDNVAVVVILEEKESCHSQNGVTSRICVANTHIHCGSDALDVRLFQVVNLIRGLEKIDSLGIPIMVCGDFNSLPGSDPHRFLINGKVGCFSKNYKDPLGIHKYLKLSHSMHLASAYARLLDYEVGQHQKEKMDYQSMEPHFTCFKPSCSRTLDYIFYSENRLKVDGVLKLLEYDSMGKRELPSPLWSSDHVAIMADFRIKQAFKGQPYLLPPADPWEQITAESADTVRGNGAKESRLSMTLISPQQSAFVKDRAISDNILLAQEMASSMGSRKHRPNVILKLDMMKAYDRVSWVFLCAILRQFGFGEHWIDMVWRCISNCWFSVMINGRPSGFFHSTRGLRQGDPLSPSLFILMAEFLSRSLNELLNMANFTPFQGHRLAIPVTHLAYADDVLVFSSANRASLMMIRKVFAEYEELSGQKVSVMKSNFFVDTKSSLGFRRRVARITSFTHAEFPFKYLGCQIYVGQRVGVFQDMVLAIQRRLLGWQNSSLSFGGRIVLIKHVLSSLHLHILAVSQPPMSVLNQITQICAKFFWEGPLLERKQHWITWDTLCRPYGEGGVGFRKIGDVADSFVAKLWWSFRAQQSLWAKYMLQRYCLREYPVVVGFRGTDSHVWRRMLRIRPDCEEFIGWFVGDGSLDLFHDNWRNIGALSQIATGTGYTWLKDFNLNGEWHLHDLFLPANISQKVSEIVLSSSPAHPIWMCESNGFFSVSSAYSLFRSRWHSSERFTRIWEPGISPKVSFFLLRLSYGRVPFANWLGRMSLHGPFPCVCCSIPVEETLDHVFGWGSLAAKVWGFFGNVVGIRLRPRAWREHCLIWWNLRGNVYCRTLFRWIPAVISWQLWKRRNLHFFEGKSDSWERVCDLVLHDLLMMWHLRFPSHILAGAWHQVVDGVLGLSPPMTFRRVCWLRPPLDTVKLNVDGCSLGNPGPGGGGALIRDSNGRLLVARAMGFEFVTSLEAEALALLVGLELCERWNYANVLVESDSKVLVSLMEGKGKVPWKLRGIIARIKQYSCLQSLSHIYREANQPADGLASEGCSRQLDLEFLSFGMLPRQVRGSLNMDRLRVPNFRTHHRPL